MSQRGIDVATRLRGCLLGHAVGDALGAPFEGLYGDAIPTDLLEGSRRYTSYVFRKPA